MEEVNIRFRSFIEKTNLSPTRFSKEIGVNHESINRLFRDIKLAPSVLLLFNSKRRFPNLNVNFLLTGEDRMFLDKIDTGNMIASLEKQVETLQAHIDKKDESIGHLAASVRNLADKLKAYEEKTQKT